MQEPASEQLLINLLINTTAAVLVLELAEYNWPFKLINLIIIIIFNNLYLTCFLCTPLRND